MIAAAFLLTTIFACKKMETSETGYSADLAETVDSSMVSDSISSAATMQMKDKQFIKTAAVNMEVKDVYEATIALEKKTTELGGFVTSSNLKSNVIEQDTYTTSDSEAMLIKKYQTENTIQVRIPTEHLGLFLQNINDQKLFLNSRTIDATDVTASMKYAELESKRNANTEKNISDLKAGKDKVTLSDYNKSEGNLQQYSNLTMADQLKYSTVDVYLKEPQLRIAEIPVINSKNIDNQYKYNFFYDAKNAVVEGFYLIQKIVIGLIRIWPILLIAGLIFYFVRKRKPIVTTSSNTPSET